MLVKKSVIDEGIRESINAKINNQFIYKEGSDLDSVIGEVLHDRDLFTYLALNFKHNQGLEIGCNSYFDDITVEEHYGLILDFNNIPRELKLYSFEVPTPLYPRKSFDLFLGNRLRTTYSQLEPESFLRNLNASLENKEKNLIEFDERFKIIRY